MMKQTQILSEHKNNIYTLNFMNKSNQLISGNEDKSIQYGNKNKIINGFPSRYQLEIINISIVQQQIIIKIQLYQEVMIILLNFG
ncbi:unnamed protein product [Paramecium pentaurelia]|uniref:Uncharacterized protein n=1 Tax=Paramecium pentaurelia TaxID=43138 RepID=A0A8S1X637_9CILI|nr:unnamed protein product [Paramecium pentaurelia]